MITKCAMLICFAIMASAVVVSANEGGQQLQLKLKVNVQEENGVEIPKFALVVTNVSRSPVSILDVRDRVDLQLNYSDVVITPLDKYFELEMVIVNPGVIEENDYIVLMPSEEIIFSLDPIGTYVKKLPAGRYEAYVKYWVDPRAKNTVILRSPDELFVIK